MRRRYWGRSRYPTVAEYLALAEFALTASSFDFAGKKGEAAPKFRNEVATARNLLANQLAWRLKEFAANVEKVVGPIITMMMHAQHERNDALGAMVPLPNGQFVMIRDMTPEQAPASLEYMRRWIADRAEPRSSAENIVERLRQRDEVTAQQYASAISFVSAAEFISAKLVMLHSGIVHSIPLYRLYPATPEREAIELWWPRGRGRTMPPLVRPAKAPTSRKKVLDPGIISAKRPQDVVREVIERTGINRTTAQRLTANMRAEMRRTRMEKALVMLRSGKSKAEVARTFGLSPSRVSAMFKGMTFPKRRKPIGTEDDDDEPADGTVPFWRRRTRTV